MSKRYAFLLLLIGLLPTILFGQNFHWAKTFGSDLRDYCTHAVFDKYGNTYVTGEFGFFEIYLNGNPITMSVPYLFLGNDPT
jgi:hypothetical protein